MARLQKASKEREPAELHRFDFSSLNHLDGGNMLKHLTPTLVVLNSLFPWVALSPLALFSFALARPKATDRVLKNGEPNEVGMSANRLGLAAQILEEETKNGRVLAASIL